MALGKSEQQLRRLVRDGKSRGYVLYSEIDELLPAGGEEEVVLDIILSELAKNDIEVLEQPGAHDFGEKELWDLSEQTDDSQPPLQMYLREILSLRRITQEDETELAKRIGGGKQDAEDAMRRLIEANLWLVVATARRHCGTDRDLLELIQEGNIGLMRAAEKFNQVRPYRFSTYAIWWVRKSIDPR